MKTAILVFARVNSKRLPRKALLQIKGKPTLWHLLRRLSNLEYPVYLCVPDNEGDTLEKIGAELGAKTFKGNPDHPLKRAIDCAHEFKIDNVIRITHDDILIDSKLMESMVKYFLKNDLDYCYVARAPEGVGCEIYKVSALEEAYKNSNGFIAEGISVYFKKDRFGKFKVDEYIPHFSFQEHYRLTMDYEGDFDLLRCVFSYLAMPFFTLDIINFFKRHPEFLKLNHLPAVTVYITNYNLGEYLSQAIQSVLAQSFQDFELIVVDDKSSDLLSFQVLQWYSLNEKVKIVYNLENIGLPACRNKAITMAKGRFIVGLDADDCLALDALEGLVNFMRSNPDTSVCYPGYFDCNENLHVNQEVLLNESHHPSGAIINRRDLEIVNYDETLKGYESYDFYLRFKKYFKIGYTKKPLWFKRNLPTSMSNNNLDAREILKKEIEARNK